MCFLSHRYWGESEFIWSLIFFPSIFPRLTDRHVTVLTVLTVVSWCVILLKNELAWGRWGRWEKSSWSLVRNKNGANIHVSKREFAMGKLNMTCSRQQFLFDGEFHKPTLLHWCRDHGVELHPLRCRRSLYLYTLRVNLFLTFKRYWFSPKLSCIYRGIVHNIARLPHKDTKTWPASHVRLRTKPSSYI